MEPFLQHIEVPLKEIMSEHGGLGTVSHLNKPQLVADNTKKFLVFNKKGQASAMILCSSPVSPKLIAREIEKATQVRGTLNSELGQVILKPLMSGEFAGLTYMVLPYCQPLSQFRLMRFLQRKYLRFHVLKWLKQITQNTLVKPSPEELQLDFLIPLEKIAANQLISEPIREAAIKAINRLKTEQWSPRYVLAHNDFWDGNLLLSSKMQSNELGFFVIDWGSATLKGHAIYDLLRIAQSLKLSNRQLVYELQQHCHILNCSIIDTESYLLASLGYLGMRLEHFPMKQYVALTENSYNLLHLMIKQWRH